MLQAGGSQGAWFYDGSSRKEDDEVLAEICGKNQSIQTVRGDAHSGALCAALLAGYSLEESLKLANCAGRCPQNIMVSNMPIDRRSGRSGTAALALVASVILAKIG